jgi:EmrB/QacA subfamily drug resistance transporter
VAVFTLASAASGLAQDPSQLIVARAAQGVGAAIIAPQGLPIMLHLVPAERRAGVFALYGALAGSAVVLGPVLGGFLVSHFGWRWIFYVNVPVGLLTLVLGYVLVPDLRPGVRHRLDLIGVALLTAGLLGVVFGLIEGQRYDWGTVFGPVTIPELIAAGLALIVVFLAYQARRQGAEPLLPFAVFGDRNFTLMTLVMAAMGFAMLGVYLPLTIYLQSVLGLSALAAGLTIAPQPLAMMLSSGVASGFVQKVGGKRLLIPGLLLFTLGVAYIDWSARAGAGRWVFLPGLVASGLGLGCVWTPVFSVATRDLRPALAGVASGVINTIQELGSVIASAAVGALLQNRLAVALQSEAATRSAALPESIRPGFVAGFGHAAKSGFEVGAGQTGGAVQLPPGIPAPVLHLVSQVAHEVFTHAFVDAMRPTLLLPIAVVLVAALATFGVRERKSAAAPAEEVAAVA